MSRFAHRRPSAALVVSIAALIVSLGGTAYAGGLVARDSVGTAQLRTGAVTSRTLHRNAVFTRAIRNGAVSAGKLKRGAVTQRTLASGLTVANAQHAVQADAATNATRAQTADTAASAGALTGVNVVASATLDNPRATQSFGEADCPAGQFAVGGGVWGTGGVNQSVNSSWPTRQNAGDPSPDAWGAWVNNNSQSDKTFTVYAICASGATGSSFPGYHAIRH